jgi:NAD(P)H dehydrogenase (quinone)
MILITGATGQLGSATIEFLLKKLPPSHLAALVRDERKAASLREQGVRICLGDYDNPAALDAAMRGIEKVLLIAGTDEENRLRQHRNVVEAAQRAGVALLAYTSRALHDRHTLANRLMEGHFQTEDLIQASGLPCVFFRNILYLDTIPRFVGEQLPDAGIRLPAGEGRVAFALRRDMAEAIATVLARPEPANLVYTLTGSESYSFHDVAAALSDLAGRPVAYTPVEPADFARQLQGRGLPEPAIQRIIGFMTDIKNGQEAAISPDLALLLGRPPTGLREGLQELYQL